MLIFSINLIDRFYFTFILLNYHFAMVFKISVFVLHYLAMDSTNTSFNSNTNNHNRSSIQSISIVFVLENNPIL